MSDRRMGLRHRAAIGITEATDAIAVVVSEEHGTISITHNGRIIRRLDGTRLQTILRAFYQLDQQPASSQKNDRARHWFSRQRVSPTMKSNQPTRTTRRWLPRVEMMMDVSDLALEVSGST